MPRLRLAVALLVVPAMLGLSACGEKNSTSSSTTAATAANCTKDALKTVKAGQLTVATDKPAYPPYFVDDDPSNGKGFESAVAFAIAKQLGYAPADVRWSVVPFNSSYAPGPKPFDFDVNQISITPARQRAVDFSSPYYTAPQAVVALKSSQYADATSLSALADAKLGVQVGTTSLDAVTSQIKPTSDPQVFNDSNDVVRALKNKQVDAIVVDLPTALYLTAAEIPTAKVVGQFEAPGGDRWGALLTKGSALTACVTRAVDRLRSSGELQAITDKWMSTEAGAPKLQ